MPSSIPLNASSPSGTHRTKLYDVYAQLLRALCIKAASVEEAKAEIQVRLEIAEFLKSLNETDGALEAYLAADNLVQKLQGDHKLIHAWIQQEMAALAWRKRDIRQAEELSRSSIDLYTQLAPQAWQLAGALTTAGNVLEEKGRYPEAEDMYYQAIELSEETEHIVGKFSPLNSLGVMAYNRGDFVKAFYFYEQAMAILKGRSGQEPKLAVMLANLGSLFHGQRKLDEAEHHYRRSLELVKKYPDLLLESTLYLNLGRTAIDKGDPEKAEELCRKSLKTRESISKNSILARSPLDCLSLAHIRKGNLAGAIDFVERALQISEAQSPGSLASGDLLLRIADIYYDLKKLDIAESYFRQALTIYAKQTPNSKLHANVLHKLAVVYSYTDRVPEAGRLFESAVNILELQLSKGHESEVDRGLHRAEESSLYLNLAEHLVQTERPEKAFHVLEHWRAGAFLAMLTERDLVFTEISPNLDRERRQISLEHDRIIQKLALDDTPGESEALEIKRVSLRARQEEIVRTIRSASPQLADLRYPRPLDSEGTRASLDANTLLLSFAVYPNHAQLFLVSPQSPLRVVRLDVRESDLRRDIEVLQNILRDTRSGHPASRRRGLEELTTRLYRNLLQPIATDLTAASRIVIVPDGPLHFLPWGALTREGTGQAPSHRFQYLAEWKPLHVVLSATVYAGMRQRRPATGRVNSIVAFGEPAYPTRFRDNTDTSIEEARYRELVSRGLRLDPLPGSRREVEGITSLFPGSARIYLGTEATEENAKRIPRDTRFVHFATHAKIDERTPLDSAVALSIPGIFSEERDNGLPQAWEIFERVRIDADLVVLSACDSGLGKEMGGEGLIGLTRAFQYAGARSVIASLWEVSDRTTAEFMLRFYRHLKEGLTKDEALRATQMEFIRGPIQVTNDKGERVDFDASAPYYWAAFQIYGDWQ